MMRSRRTSLSTCRRAVSLVTLLATVMVCSGRMSADEPDSAVPLHVRIDRLIETHATGPLAGPASDADFIRRATLDLNGLLPDPATVRSFLDDTDEQKRTRLVDDLLSAPRYARHFGRVFDVMLMERRRASNVKDDVWLEFLVGAFRENRPADEMFAELIRADGVDPEQRAPARFLLDREAEPNLLTRDVGRLFFGRDLQCAQCHNHPWIDDYRQPEYYGLYAFLNRSYLFDDPKLKKKVLAEKAEGDVTFSSVFTGEEGETRPRVPGGTMLSEPVFAEAELYEVKPAKNVRPVPRYSRRERLGDLIGDGNRQFARNLANRLWAHLMGRGLVDPVDLDHSDNPPVYPLVLELLTDEFLAHDLDIRWLLRELALTETYQRSIELPADDVILASVNPAEQQLALLTKQVEEQDALATTLQEQVDQQREQLNTQRERLAELTEQHQAAKTAADEIRSQVETLQADRKPLQEKLANADRAAQLLAQAQSDSAAALKHLVDDPGLRQVHDALAAHAKRLSGSVEPLKEQLAKLDAQLKTLEPQAAEKLKTFEQTDVQLKAAAGQVREGDAAVTSTTARYVEARGWRNVYEQRQESIRRLLAFRDARESVEEATEREAAALAALDAQAEGFRTVQVTFKAAEAAAAKARAAQSAAHERLTQVESAAEQTQHALTAVQSAREELAGLHRQRQELLAAQAGADPGRDDPGKPEADTVITETDSSALESAIEQLEVAHQTHQRRLAALQPALVRARGQLEANKRALSEAEAQESKQRERFEAVEARRATLQQAVVQQRDAVETSQAQLASLRDEIAADMARTFQLASLKPLSPEQMAWSVMAVLGVVERQEQASLAELRKQADAAKSKSQDAAAQGEDQQASSTGATADSTDATSAVTPAALEQAVFAKLRGHEGDYVRLYGAGAGQPQSDFFATADQALYLANGGKLLQWLAPQSGNLTSRLIEHEDPAALARELYLSVLIREPDATEIEDVVGYLQQREDQRTQAVQELVWGLLTSSEFRFVH